MTSASRTYLAVAIAAGAVFAIGLGMRQSLPLFISSINSHTAVGYATISLAFGIAQLMWGVAQPIAGAIADRHGSRPVMIAGALLLCLATALTPFASSATALIVLIGFIGSLGAGAFGPALLMSAANRWIPAAKRAFASGVVNAGGSFGQFTLVPFAQLLIGLAGWQPAMMLLGATGLISIPLILWLTSGGPAVPAHAVTGAASLREAIGEAAVDRSYLLLNLGFFTCGFHVAFIATHLPGIVATCELPPSVGAWSLAIIGLFNIAGSLWVGRAIQEWRMKLALAGIYAARAAIIVIFYYSPKTELAFFLFSAGIGFTYLSTVPPTMGLVAKLHGAKYMATLFGIVMLSHQVGGFLGAWLGGKAFEATGSYDWMWWADIALCLMAAVVHLPIREARKLAPAAA
ncbi:MAG TPA: MFS transporter [Burkholderiales bacterium]|jgi:predicted MFS family arabinose efflux permease|nr:MFS transporter [Burkholderiales bacterium]